MADKNKNEITAKSLLSRLRSGKDEEAKAPVEESLPMEEDLVAPDLGFL